MMDKIPCPGCRTELDFEVTTCPICLRPRSKYEITRAYASLRADQARARKRPFIVAGWLLSAAVVGGALYRFRAPVKSAAAAARARFARFADEAMDPKHLSNHAADAPPPPDAPPSRPLSEAPASAPGPASSPVQPAPASPALAPLTGPLAPAMRRPVTGDLPLPAMDPNYQWALRGRVYDLLTLKPVTTAIFDVKNSFGGMAGGFAADADGRYLVLLPRIQEGGYEIVETGAGYYSTVFYESDIPYAQLSASERRDLAESAASGDSHPSPITDMTGESSLHRDIFVVPQR